MSNASSMNDLEEPPRPPGCRDCCSCPHSKYAILPCILSVLVFIAADYVAFYCDFIDVNGLGAFGLNTYEAQDEREDSIYQCVLYSKGDLDYVGLGAAWQAARSFAIITFALGLVLMVVTLCTACVAFHPRVIRVLACGFGFCGVIQSLVFVGLSSDFCSEYFTCDLAGGAITAMIATVFWFATAVAVAFMPKFQGYSNEEDAPEAIPTQSTPVIMEKSGPEQYPEASDTPAGDVEATLY